MKRRTNFLFILTDKIEGANTQSLGNVYEARKDSDGNFTIGWHDYGFLKTLRYDSDDVAFFLREGYWEMITEHEAYLFFKGLY